VIQLIANNLIGVKDAGDKMDRIQDIADNLTIDMSKVIVVSKSHIQGDGRSRYTIYLDNGNNINIYEKEYKGINFIYPREKFIKLWKDVVNGEK